MTPRTNSASTNLALFAFGLFTLGIASGALIVRMAKLSAAPILLAESAHDQEAEGDGTLGELPSDVAPPILIRNRNVDGTAGGNSVLIPVQKSRVIQAADEYRLAAQTAVLESFGLTLSETRIALQVINGASFAAIAEALNSTDECVRKTASRVYRKARVRRRQELVDLVSTEMTQYVQAVAFLPLGYAGPSS